MDLTFGACSYLADLMARYSRIETHYWERNKHEISLEEGMIKVYTAVLAYAAEVQESINSTVTSE